MDSTANEVKKMRLLKASPWYITITVRCESDECEVYV
jgi:hypothetical protein